MEAQAFKKWVHDQAYADTPRLSEGSATKRCTNCNEIKAKTNFTWSSGIGYFCKECSRKKLGAVKKHLQRRSGVRK